MDDQKSNNCVLEEPSYEYCLREDSPNYDLEERTFRFAKAVRAFLKQVPRSICNIEDGKQLARSSGSVGANYIEANGALGKKDFLMRLRISRKECKESRYWLQLLDLGSNTELEKERSNLVQETVELISIFSTILRKCS